MSSLYSQNLSFSPARSVSSHIGTNPDVYNRYMKELLAEREKLIPFMQVFPICCRLLDQEILRVSGATANQRLNVYRSLQHSRSSSPMASLNTMSDVGFKHSGGWNGFQNQQLADGGHEMTIDLPAPPGSPGSYTMKKVLRLEIPVDKYPNFNFVGRLLGPRGNSLKRVEASTGCRIFIRGKGSIKESEKEESLRGRPGYEHLNDQLHVLIEAELPANVIDVQLKEAKDIVQELLKPVDESHDLYKRQQLRELALINNTFREESPQARGSLSPFNPNGLKRAKPGWEL